MKHQSQRGKQRDDDAADGDTEGDDENAMSTRNRGKVHATAVSEGP